VYTQDEEPCNDGSYLLAKNNKVLAINNMILVRTRIIKQECMYLITLLAKTRVSGLLEKKTLKEELAH